MEKPSAAPLASVTVRVPMEEPYMVYWKSTEAMPCAQSAPL